MKALLLTIAAAGSMFVAAQANAVDAAAAQALAQKSGCLACHSIDKKVLGPSYKDVAAKYAADGGAAEKLAKKIKSGGAGVWGPIPMPPHPQVSDADSKAMATYVMSVK